MWKFLGYIFASVGFGFLSGSFSSLLFKHVQMLRGSPIIETIIILVWAIVTYHITEIWHATSGVVCLFCCGLTMGHYTWYNLSAQGRTTSSVVFNILRQASEAIVFSYIGLCTFTHVGEPVG